ncbi:protein PDF [Condylostylus longicornis]|uniref:protein PDF n=1 Tax=Condylostylus longicornis TaxID=2530218 RepID=UPI00244DB830|nr:protein PDF [Condylostylus longicornis]
MNKFSTLFILSIICVLVVALPRPDEERYLDKEYARELIAWLAAIDPSASNNPCKYLTSNGGNMNYLTPQMPKRNSELINSLLSIPKNMNEAGK